MSLVGPIIIGVASLGSAMLTVLGTQTLQKRRQRQSLRTAFKTDVEKVGVHNWGNGALTEVDCSIQPRTVFEANADKIGMLSQPEVEAIVNLYLEIESLENWLHDTDPERINWDTLDERKSDIEDLKKDALRELKQRI